MRDGVRDKGSPRQIRLTEVDEWGGALYLAHVDICRAVLRDKPHLFQRPCRDTQRGCSTGCLACRPAYTIVRRIGGMIIGSVCSSARSHPTRHHSCDLEASRCIATLQRKHGAVWVGAVQAGPARWSTNLVQL